MQDIKERLTTLGKRALLVLMVCGVGLSSSWAWEVKLDGTANGVDEARAVAVDATGHVIAAGYAENTGTGKDFTVVKYSATDGTVLWRREINGSGNTDDMALAVAVDTAGHVIAAGYLT